MTREAMRIGIIFLFLFLCSSAIAEENTATIKIGFIADLSGHTSYWGKQSVLGAKLAEQDLQAEGKNVQVVIGDSTFKPAAAISELQKMLYSDKVDAVFSESPPIVNALSPIVRNANKLFVGSSATASFLETNQFAFKSYLDFAKSCQGMAQVWKDQGIKKPAMLRVPFEQGDICQKGISVVYGDILEVMFEPGETLSSQILKLKKDKIDGVFFVGYEADGLNMIKALSEARYLPYIAAQTDALCLESHLEKYAPFLDKITTFGFLPLLSEFQQKIFKADPKNSSVARSAVAISYLTIRQMYDSIASCPNDLNCQAQKMADSKPSDLLLFKGYNNRIAEYAYQYFSWKGGRGRSMPTGTPEVFR